MPATATGNPAATKKTPKGALLFVDDEPNILSALRRLFRPKGYTVHVADSGPKGLETLEQHPIDVVVSDMRMPLMDGAAFLAQCSERWPNVVRILLTGQAEMEDTVRAINKGRIFSYFSKPLVESELRLGIDNALQQKHLVEERENLLKQLAARNKELKTLNASLDNKVQVRTAQLQTALGDIRSANQELKRNYSDTVKAFSRFVDLRKGGSLDHGRRVTDRARRLAVELGTAPEELQDIVFAGLLLQVGTLSLPDKLIGRPVNNLLKQERETYQRHAAIGASVLRDISPLAQASRLIAMQYECFDGSGVPNGLSGEDIPLGARILAVVRDYDQFLEGRLTGKLMTASEAQDQLRRLRGKKYDPDVVDALLHMVGEVRQRVYRPVVEVSPSELIPGMEVVEIIHDGQVFLRDVELTAEMIEEIEALHGEVNVALSIKVRARK